MRQLFTCRMLRAAVCFKRTLSFIMEAHLATLPGSASTHDSRLRRASVSSIRALLGGIVPVSRNE